jgi:hypothetical protein
VNLDSSWWDDALRRLLRLAVPTISREESTESTMTLPADLLRLLWLLSVSRSLRRTGAERLVSGVLMRILLPLIHLLSKLLRLLLVRKAQPCHAVLQLECVKEHAVLIVLKCVVDLLVPDDSTVGGRYVHKLDPEGISHEIIGENSSAL